MAVVALAICSTSEVDVLEMIKVLKSLEPVEVLLIKEKKKTYFMEYVGLLEREAPDADLYVVLEGTTVEEAGRKIRWDAMFIRPRGEGYVMQMITNDQLPRERQIARSIRHQLDILGV